MDIRLGLMAGTDIPMPEIQLTLHQPRITEIALMGDSDFFKAAQYLCLKKEQFIEDKRLLSTMDNFQVLMKVIEQQKGSNVKTTILTFLSLLFPMYSSMMTPNSIVFRCAETKEIKLVDKDNFEILQSYLRKVLCLASIFPEESITYNPANAAAQAIADKIMAGRRKVAEIKSREQEQGDSLLGRYISILTVGLKSMSLDNLLNLTLYQLFDLMDRYTLWLNWNLDQRQRLAGITPKKEVENWMKSIH